MKKNTSVERALNNHERPKWVELTLSAKSVQRIFDRALCWVEKYNGNASILVRHQGRIVARIEGPGE
jgi:hypothetical protein